MLPTLQDGRFDVRRVGAEVAYVDMSGANLAPGATVRVTLQFTDTVNNQITYATEVVAGFGNR